jgi:cytosine/uracil/thiamine/allantoin permease
VSNIILICVSILFICEIYVVWRGGSKLFKIVYFENILIYVCMIYNIIWYYNNNMIPRSLMSLYIGKWIKK